MHDNENIVRNKGHFPLLERRNPQYSLSRVSWLDMVIEQEHSGVIDFLETVTSFESNSAFVQC